MPCALFEDIENIVYFLDVLFQMTGAFKNRKLAEYYGTLTRVHP